MTAPRTCDCGGCPECLSTVRLNAIRAAQSAKEAAAEGLARALDVALAADSPGYHLDPAYRTPEQRQDAYRAALAAWDEQAHVARCRESIRKIEEGLKRHAEARKFHREGWGYVGDVRHLRDCLAIAEQWINPGKGQNA